MLQELQAVARNLEVGLLCAFTTLADTAPSSNRERDDAEMQAPSVS